MARPLAVNIEVRRASGEFTSRRHTRLLRQSCLIATSSQAAMIGAAKKSPMRQGLEHSGVRRAPPLEQHRAGSIDAC